MVFFRFYQNETLTFSDWIKNCINVKKITKNYLQEKNIVV
ncbi:hypothetical protein RV18_GL003398 [Enterococcus termitis]|nr:hypothetical protein RV18_GL003398 [Enterococcus termitis]